jgi:histidinol-phosphate aminotransferase
MIECLIRDNIRKLTAYASARSEFKGAASVFLDANENAMGSPAGGTYNRYPDPLQQELKKIVGVLKRVKPESLFLGNGSDEPIDLLFRIFCNPGQDNVIQLTPTYGMYEVSANINDIAVRNVALSAAFRINIQNVLLAADAGTKMIFICSPNNPTGNLMKKEDIEFLLQQFKGLVVVDEAYIDFAPAGSSVLELLKKYEQLVVLQTFSKAWGMAGLRIGMAMASPLIISLMNKVKAPYNISALAQEEAVRALRNQKWINTWTREIIHQRSLLSAALTRFPFIKKVFPSEANFLLVKVPDAKRMYAYLLTHGIVVRDRSSVKGCEQCLRITVGSAEENEKLLLALQNYT